MGPPLTLELSANNKLLLMSLASHVVINILITFCGEITLFGDLGVQVDVDMCIPNGHSGSQVSGCNSPLLALWVTYSCSFDSSVSTKSAKQLGIFNQKASQTKIPLHGLGNLLRH